MWCEENLYFEILKKVPGRRQNEMKGGDVLDWKRLNLKIVETFQSGVFAPFRSNWWPFIATNFEEILGWFSIKYEIYFSFPDIATIFEETLDQFF